MTFHSLMLYEGTALYSHLCKLEPLGPISQQSHAFIPTLWPSLGSLCSFAIFHYCYSSRQTLDQWLPPTIICPPIAKSNTQALQWSMSGLLLHSLIVVLSADLRFLSNQLVQWQWTLSLRYKACIYTQFYRTSFPPKYISKNHLSHKNSS